MDIHIYIWVSINGSTSIVGWFKRENPTKMDIYNIYMYDIWMDETKPTVTTSIMTGDLL
jgi:hypothetical protein